MAAEITQRSIVSVTGVSAGLRYAEVVFDDTTSPGSANGIIAGLITSSSALIPFLGICISTTGRIWVNGNDAAAPTFTDGPTFSAGGVAMFSLQCSTGKVWLGKVGTGWYNAGDPAALTGETGTLTSVATTYVAAGIFRVILDTIPGAKFSLRTQASQFTGSIPSGFSAWYP